MKIVIGTVHGEDVNGWFFHSMLGLASYVRKVSGDEHSVNYLHQDDWAIVRSGPALALGRGRLIGTFLDDTDGDALVMLDADMAFTPDIIVSMVNAFSQMRETYENVGMLGGLAFICNEPRAEHPKPNLWVEEGPPGHITALDTYEPDTLYEVAATGGACVIIAREVLEELVKDGDRAINPFHHVPLVNWHMVARSLVDMDDANEIQEYLQSHVLGADQLGEDLSFCYRMKKAGYRIFVHTGLRFDHAKSTLIGEPEYMRSDKQIPLVPVARIPSPPPSAQEAVAV